MDEKDKKIADLEKIIALLPGNIYWKDREGKYLGSNNGFAHIVKLPNHKAIIGKSDYDLMSKELADLLHKADQGIMAADKARVLEELGFDEKGDPAIYLTKKVPLHDEEGKVIGILGTSIDITDRKKIENELYRTKDELETANKAKSEFIASMAYMNNIIALLPGNIYWKDKNGRLLGCNENLAKLFNLPSPAAIINKTDYDLMGAEYADKVVANDEEVIRSKTEKILEEYGPDVNGNPAVYLTKKTPLYNENHEVIGLLGVSLDITDRKKHEESLRQAKEKAEAANRAKSDFLAVVSHELRIPLTAILGMAQLIEGDNLYQEQQAQLTDLVRSSEHLLSLINDLLDIAKLEAGKMELHFAPIDLRRLIEEMAMIISHQARLKGLDLFVDYPLEVPAHIMADARAMRQIILNLTGNAIKFTEQGYIAIRVSCVEQQDRQVTLAVSVEDTGIGIPSHKQEVIFDRFVQNDNTRTRRYGGTGLGLAIAKEYVEAMGGSIKLQSEENKGSIFTCEIPFELYTANSYLNPWEIYRSTVKILIVDDTLRGEILNKQINSSLSMVSDGKNALNVILAANQAKNPLDIVIIDQQLSSVDALHLGKEIKQNHKLHQPMLLLLVNKQSILTYRNVKESYGFFDLLTKPIQPTEILINLTAAWERWQEANSIKNKIIINENADSIINILLVEDDLIIQRVHSLMLQKLNCVVDVAPDGMQALALFENKPYDLVFLDIGLPDIDGFTVAKEMRKREVTRGYTPIIGLTGYNSTVDQEKALQAGMDQVLIKPVKAQELAEVINRCIKKVKKD